MRFAVLRSIPRALTAPLRLGGVRVAAGVSLVGCAIVTQVLLMGQSERAAASHRPVEVHDLGYVSSNDCRSCHASHYASWANSYHHRMTQLATPDHVIGNFDHVQLGSAPRYRLETPGEHFFVSIQDAPAEAERRAPISLLTGSHHMQIYWYETGHDKSLGQLPFVFLKADQRWVPRNAIFIEPPAPMKPAAEGRWNASCIACHTTLGQPRIDAAGAFDTRVAEFGIACEACHGPGAEHASRNASPLVRYSSHLTGHGDDSIVQPAKLTHDRASYICSQCHATWLHNGAAGMRDWNEHGPAYRPGGDPTDFMLLLQPTRASSDPRIASVLEQEASLVESQFWSDGMVRISGREFNGMIDSACYAKGELSCLSCHTMHQTADDRRPSEVWSDDQLGVGMDGDRACLQCHQQFASDLTAHTHHRAESAGSRCYNCHMPYTSYGLMKALRSHRIDRPGVDATVATGRPNACNLCHLDKSLGWTAAALQKQYGIHSAALDPDQQNIEAALLLGLTGDAGQRALIAWALGWKPAQVASSHAFMPALLGTLMDDPYDAVRYIAERSLRSLPDVDLHDLRYDFLQRPNERAAVAGKVTLASSHPLPPAQQQQQQRLFERLAPTRNDRPVRLLE